MPTSPHATADTSFFTGLCISQVMSPPIYQQALRSFDVLIPAIGSPCRDRLPQGLSDSWIWTDFLMVVCVGVHVYLHSPTVGCSPILAARISNRQPLGKYKAHAPSDKPSTDEDV